MGRGVDNLSPGFPAPLIAASMRSSMLSPATIPGRTTSGNATAQALQALMLHSPEGEKKWLMNEILGHNVPAKRRYFPMETSRALREALDDTLSLALSLHESSPLAFIAFALFVLFPRLLLRPLPDGCQGSFAAASLSRRCNLLKEGKIATLLSEAHEAQVGRVAKQMKVASIPTSTTTFSKTTRDAILAGAGAMGRACKLAFSYGLETDPEIAATFLAKLTLKARHTHIPAHVRKVKPPGNRISSRGCFRGDAKEIGYTPGRMDVGTSSGRRPDLIHGYAPPEVCGTLFKWILATRHVGLPGLGVVMPFPQEATGGKNFNNRPGTQTDDGGVGSHPIRLHSNGDDEPLRGRGKAGAFSPVLLRSQRRGLASHLGL